MSYLRELKEVKVKEISKELAKASSLVIAEYRGLTVTQLETLRKEAKSQGIKVKVYKNRLFKHSILAANYGDLVPSLVGPNIFLFGGENDLAPAKLVQKFAKLHPQIVVIKAGIYEKAVVDAEEVKRIASLPSYEEALTILANSLLTPLKQLGLGMKMLVDENKISQ